MFESLELELARLEIKSYIENFDEETIVQESRQAQDCLDCEAFLSRGIKALAWVERGEESLFKGHAAGLLDVTQEIETAIDDLYEGWLRPCSFAES